MVTCAANIIYIITKYTAQHIRATVHRYISRKKEYRANVPVAFFFFFFIKIQLDRSIFEYTIFQKKDGIFVPQYIFNFHRGGDGIIILIGFARNFHCREIYSLVCCANCLQCC